MKQLQFAVKLETGIHRELKNLSTKGPPELISVTGGFVEAHAKLALMLNNISYDDLVKGKYQASELGQIMATDEEWRRQLAAFRVGPENSVDYLTALWTIHIWLDRSAQYYQQAARNSEYPSLRLFFENLAQLKQILKRRADSLLRTAYNAVWEEVGFAPFLLGKS